MTVGETERQIVVYYEPGDKGRVTSQRPSGDFALEDAAALRRAADTIEFWATQKECPKPVVPDGLELSP